MKSIKEKQMLVKWAKVMNEPIDPLLLEEVERYENIQNEIINSVRQNSINDLQEASKVANQFVEKIKEFPVPPTLEEVLHVLKEETNELVQAQSAEAPKEREAPPLPTRKTKRTKSLAEQAAEHITKEVKLEEKSDSFQQPDPTLVDKNFKAVQKKLKFLEQAIGKIAAHGPGSGSYWLYDLGDTNYDLVKNPSNNDVLTFNSANSKWEVGTVNNALGTRYHGSYFSNVNQTSANTSNSYFVTVNNIDFQSGFTTDGANLIATYSGVYNVQFSGQLHYNGGGGSGKTVEIWLTKNGENVPETNTRVDIASASPFVVAAWNFLVPLSAGDKTALKWSTDNLQMGFDASSGTNGPNVPSIILTITQV